MDVDALFGYLGSDKGRKCVYKNCNHLSGVLYLLIFNCIHLIITTAMLSKPVGLRNRNGEFCNMWLVESKSSEFSSKPIMFSG